ncbi:MAG: PIN domain-containing protein, partial [Acetobacteraceae bacterium]|nr:PIN domain-containing protein [Acetobacteraceae bacterium]
MRVALDTNMLLYAKGLSGAERKAEALAALALLEDENVVIPLQVLGETFAVLTRKARWTGDTARAAVQAWMDRATLVETTSDILMDAMQLAVQFRLAFWDSVILAAAAEVRCDVLLTEDMQHGFVWRGVTVRNPFA